MRGGARVALVVALLTLAGPARADQPPGGEGAPPTPVILDTDSYADVDDAGAAAVLNALHDRGEASILAMMVNTPSTWGPPCVDAINTYYGHSEIPIGSIKPNDDGVAWRGYKEYCRTIAQHFPTGIEDGTRVPDATTLYREVLSRQPARSVVIVSVGFLANLSRLLDSGPDRFSPLTGYELVRQKVRLLTVMGGAYPAGIDGYNFSGDRVNGVGDPDDTAHVAAQWPTRIVYSGLGETVMTGARLFTETPPTNPVRAAYELYVGGGNNRSSWDQIAAWYAVRGADPLFAEAGDTGSNHVDPRTGANAWAPFPDKDQAYLVQRASDAEVAKALEDLMVQGPLHCHDHSAPRSRLFRRSSRVSAGGVLLRGRSRDRGCRGGSSAAERPGAVRRVFVAVAHRLEGGRCAFLRQSGRLAEPRSCRRPIWLRAAGGERWALTVRARLPRGRYVVWVRAVDREGNSEAPRRARSDHFVVG